MDSLKPSSVKNPPTKMKPRKTSYKGDAAATRNSTGSTRQTEPGSLPSSRRYSSSGFGKDESYYYCSVQGCSKTFNSLEEVQSHMRNHQAKSSSDPKNPQQRYSARLRARSIRISDEKKLKESEATEAQAGASTSATTVATASEEAKAAGRKRTSEVETNSIKLNRIKKTSGDAKEGEAKVDIPESNDKPAAAVPATTAVEEEPSAAVATTTAPGQVSSIAATFLANSTPSRATRLSRTAKFSGDCPICSRTFLSKHGLWMHLTAYKTSELKCVKCSLDFQKHEGLMHHAYHVHAANKSVMTVVTPTEEAASITTPAAVTTATDATADVTASAQPETPLQAELKNNHVASVTTDSTVVAAGDSDNKEVVDDMDCGGEEDKQQQQQQGVVGGEEAAMESGGDQSVDGSSVPSPPSTIASTGTNNNEQPPRSTSALTVTSNNRPPASKRFKKSDYVHGFDDLADHDFSSSVFTSIAEMMCNKNPHLLMEKNGHYVFHCKLCDILFPCLDVLDQHFVRRHPEHIADIEAIKTGKQPAPKEEVDGAVAAAAQPEPQQASQVPEAAEEKMQVDGAAEEKEGEKAVAEEENMQIDEGSSGNKENEEKAADVDDDDVSEFGEEEKVGNEFNLDDPNSEPSDEVLQMLGLKRVEDEEKAAQLARENKQPETAGITYGMDNDFVFTSPAPGFHKQPTWMRSENSGSLVIPDKRYISQYATNGSASQSNTNNMLKLYGIQISTGRNGKKTYWCRMCDYNSFEKSTILRHQRTHTGIRPFTCRDCNYSFTTKANCERHIKKRHVEILEREGVDAKSLVVANDEQIKRLREGGYGLKDPNFAPNGANGRQRHRPYSSKCLVCSMIFSSHSNCVRHLVREHGVPEDRATERLMNILPSTSGTPISTSPTDTAHVYYSAAESDERVDYQSGTSTPVAPNMNNNDEGGGDNNNGGDNNDMSRDQLEGYFDSFLQQGEEAGNKDPESVEDGKWRRRTLTPLAKITAFNAAAAKIREYFERDYASVLAQFNINSSGSNGGVQPSIPQVRSKLFSLLTSTAHSVTTAPGINRNKHRVGGGVRGGAVGSSHHPTAMLRTGATAVPSAASASPYGARPMHTTLKRPFPKQQQQNDINFRPIKPKRKRSMQQDPSMPGTSTGMTRDQLIDICNDSHDGGDESDHLAAAGSGLSRNPVTSQENIARGFISNSKSKFVKVKKNIHLLQASKLPHFAASSFQSLPTMVGMSSKFGTAGAPVVPNGVASSSSGAAAAVGRDPNDRRLQPPRKCPKCPKSFQWSSSHRRHVATHTGLKPYMCSHCNMRFTTRSNLLRHAYRRHDVDRSSADRSSVVVNLSRDEQERFAEIEARTFEEQQHDVSAEEQDGNNTENQDTTADEPSNALSIVEHNSYDESLAASQSGESSMFDQTPSYSSMFEPATIITSSAIDRTPSTPVTPQTSSFTSAKIKKYLCGKCNVPFANRSNVVRHLAKQHHITKDHKNFKSLLVKIDGSFVVERRNRNNRHNHHHHQDSPSMVTNSSLFDTTPNHSAAGSRSLGMMSSPRIEPHAATPVSIPKPSKLSATAASSTPLPPTKVSVVTTPVMKLEPPTGPVASTSARYIAPKEFKCTICNMGFTKRNNAARHVQQQHQIKRTGLGKSNFVVRINEEGDELETSNMSQAAADPTTTTTADVTNDDEAKEGAQTAAVGEVAGKRRKITNPFSCGFCKRIFENVDKLKEHIVVHQTPHPWECPLCSTPFTSKYNCQRHLGRRHGRLDLTPLFVGGENELLHDDGGVLMSNDDDQVLDLSTYSSSNFQPTSLYIAATTTEQQQQI